MRPIALRAGALAALALTVVLAGERPAGGAQAPFPNDAKTIVHVLGRIGFGARQGDIGKVRAAGLKAYIDDQLRPERIDDSRTDARLAALPTLGMSSEDIATRFARPLFEARRARRSADSSLPGARPGMAAAQQQAARVLAELSAAKVLRAVYSERQLQEVLVDFWFNHFNVDARKGQGRFVLTAYERDTVRPHVLGKFRELLAATAGSPAMLFYLDNWLSAGGSGRNGLNENYARELMELHTLGVDGGYTQKDVTEVARAFTGWTIVNPRTGGGFVFNPRKHDAGQKVVLGHVIKAGGGLADGEQVLDILAAHPSTARFVSTKLARRFVADTPPPALVDRMTTTFQASGGNLRDVMHTLLTAPEFLAADAYRVKVKTPFEFVVSALRATGTEIEDAAPLVGATRQLGMALYMCQPPTGYADSADAWVNTGALVNRMNFALQLAAGRVRGSRPAPDAGNRIIELVLNDDVSAITRETIARATTTAQKLALTLGSPEFQQR